MSPQDFTFKLSIPNDPAGADVVAAVAQHAVEYANVDSGKGAAFVDRARSAAVQVLKGGSPSHCQAVFAAAGGQLTMTLGGQSVTEPLPA
jgi:hypothetical protein